MKKLILILILFLLLLTIRNTVQAADFDYYNADREQLIERCLWYAQKYKMEMFNHKDTKGRLIDSLRNNMFLQTEYTQLSSLYYELNLDYLQLYSDHKYLLDYRYELFDLSFNIEAGAGTAGMFGIQSNIHLGYGMYGYLGCRGLYDYTFNRGFGIIAIGGIGYSL